MSPRAQENVIAGSLFCIFAGYTAMCLQFGPNARLVPLPMAILGLVFVAVQLIRINLGSQFDVADDASRDSDATTLATDRDTRRELQAFGCVVVFVCLVALLGPVVAVFLFSSSYLIPSGHAGIAKAITAASVFTAVIYLLFVVALQLQLYHGILEPLVERL